MFAPTVAELSAVERQTVYHPAIQPLSNFPYSKNFDGVTAPAIPSCSTVQNVNASNIWNWCFTPAAVVIGAPNSMVYPYNSIVAADDWFFLQSGPDSGNLIPADL